MAEEDSGPKINIFVKKAKEKKSLEIEESATVKELREEVAKQFSITVEQVCLIFAGKILKDHEDIKSHNIRDGLTIHLVVRSGNKQQEGSSTSSTTPQQEGSSTSSTTPQQEGSSTSSTTPNNQTNPPGANLFGGLPGFGGLQGLGGLGRLSSLASNPAFTDIIYCLLGSLELMSDPDVMSQLFGGPIDQPLFSNPEETLRDMIMTFKDHPQMQQIMERLHLELWGEMTMDEEGEE